LASQASKEKRMKKIPKFPNLYAHLQPFVFIPSLQFPLHNIDFWLLYILVMVSNGEHNMSKVEHEHRNARVNVDERICGNDG
jgi:hypothetical protein